MFGNDDSQNTDASNNQQTVPPAPQADAQQITGPGADTAAQTGTVFSPAPDVPQAAPTPPTQAVDDMSTQPQASPEPPTAPPVFAQPAAPVPDEPSPPAPEPQESSESTEEPVEADTPTLTGDQESSLLDIKQKALQNLTPLIDELQQPAEDKFKTMMMLIQASDNPDLLQKAYDAASSISDEKERAKALLDVVNEINYFTHKKPAEPTT